MELKTEGPAVAKPAEPKKAPTGWKPALGTVGTVVLGGVALVAILRIQGCEPKSEPIIKEKVVNVCPAPVKGDGKCEADKGEHDPWLPQFDPEACGFCGDAKITPPETADTCFVDAMCPDGEKDQTTYHMIAKFEDGTYGLDKVAVDECDKNNAFYCVKDCPPEEPKKVSGHRARPRQEVEEPSVEGCPSKPAPCKGVESGRIVARMLRAVNEGDLRQECKGKVELSGEFLIRPNGVTSQRGTIAVTCNGSAMGDYTGKTANLTGVTVGAPGGCECILKPTVEVAKAGTSG